MYEREKIANKIEPMTNEERVQLYTRRKADGTLVSPRTLKAHIKEILIINPDALRAEDMATLNRL